MKLMNLQQVQQVIKVCLTIKIGKRVAGNLQIKMKFQIQISLINLSIKIQTLYSIKRMQMNSFHQLQEKQAMS